MSRLDDTFDRLRANDEKAMGLFLTDGFPEPNATVPLLHALDRGDVDFIELGMPFSDPLAEGRPIQEASARALENGVTMRDTFQRAETFRAESETPVLLMGYVNPVLKYGIEAFCRDAAAAGVDGLILPDLPPEESDPLTAAAADHDLNPVTTHQVERLGHYASELAERTDQLARAQADYQNYKKRMQRRVEETRLEARVGLIRSLVNALDDLDRALANADPEDKVAQGITMVAKQLTKELGDQGVEAIAPEAGDALSPHHHEALLTEASEEVPDGRVLETLQKGYLLGDKLVRPALVKVSDGPPSQDGEPGTSGPD
jgi:molecular chaperone GrpE (heat shock protein)